MQNRLKCKGFTVLKTISDSQSANNYIGIHQQQ